MLRWSNDDLRAGAKDMMQPHIQDLLAFLRAVDAYPAHLVGNSWGAFICLRAAIQEPAAVRSLVLEEPPIVLLVIGAPPTGRHLRRLSEAWQEWQGSVFVRVRPSVRSKDGFRLTMLFERTPVH